MQQFVANYRDNPSPRTRSDAPPFGQSTIVDTAVSETPDRVPSDGNVSVSDSDLDTTDAQSATAALPIAIPLAAGTGWVA
jgi:hypothetical protein